MNEDFWHSAQEAWQAWQELPPEVQLHLRAAAVLVATLVAARAVGWMVGRKLYAVHFDAALRRPWLPSPAAGHPEAHTLTPTRLITGLVRLTVWGGGVWCLARLYDWPDLARGLEWFAGRAWSFAGVILGALFLSRLFSEKVVEVVQASPLRQKLDAWLPTAGLREPRVSGAAMVAGLLIDAVVILLVALLAADLMGWTLTGSALAATWQLVLHASTAAVASLIGWLGARWLRAQVVADAGPASSPARVAHYAGTAVMGCATLLAILLLAGNSPTYFGLVILLLFVALLWPAQRWLPDIYAGVILNVQQVKEVQIDGSAYRLGAVGLVQTELSYPDGILTLPNRVILVAHLGRPTGGAGPRSEAGSPDGKHEEASKANESQPASLTWSVSRRG